MATPAAYIAFTAPVNPPEATPVLTIDQIWAGLQRKVRDPSAFVGGAIKSTDVLSETKDEHGRDVITRDVVFSADDRRAREVCTFFPKMKVEVSNFWKHGIRYDLEDMLTGKQFIQPDGTRVLNTVADGADGQIYLTYEFEWYMAKDTSVETQQENITKWKKMATGAVNSSIDKIREMVQNGKI